ncbi:MAG: MATE family efflux transporter [Cytophagales bacterium]|nr:MATE family efflux transporter [Cytophagales bacterium]MDW8383167.1 MATE family efflux transporter [Flammeovirgaceae bacterium]
MKLDEYKKILALTFPLIITQGGQVLTGIVDNIMIGNYSTIDLAASAFANSVFSNFLVISIGFAYGITPLVGNALGKKDFESINNILSNGLIINIIFSALITILLFASSNYLKYLQQEPQVVARAIPYYHLLATSLIPLAIFYTLKQFTEGTSRTKPGMLFTLIGNVINILLNYIMIFGKLGFPPLGLVGAGWATLLARICMAIGMTVYVFKKQNFQKLLQEFSILHVNLSICKKILNISIPIAIQFCLEVTAFNAGTIVVGWLGTVSLAAHQIAMSLVSLLFMTASGFSQAATIRISNLIGEQNISTAKQVFQTCSHLVLFYMTVVVLITFWTAPSIASWHTSDKEVIKIATELIVIACCFEIFDGLQVVFIGALRGIGDVKTPFWVALLAYWIVALPIGYAISFQLHAGATGIWIGFLIGLVLAAILLLVRFKRKISILERMQQKSLKKEEIY